MNTPSIAAIFVVLGSAASAAEPPPQPTPRLYEALVQCRSISADAARLACLDAGLAALDRARQQSDIVIIDRQQIGAAKRTLFGLTIPKLDILGGGDGPKEEVDQVDGVIASAARDGDGRWTFRLADGARWLQIDNRVAALAPKPGDPVAIRRAAMGSFMMRIRGRPGLRVRRLS